MTYRAGPPPQEPGDLARYVADELLRIEQQFERVNGGASLELEIDTALPLTSAWTPIPWQAGFPTNQPANAFADPAAGVLITRLPGVWSVDWSVAAQFPAGTYEFSLFLDDVQAGLVVTADPANNTIVTVGAGRFVRLPVDFTPARISLRVRVISQPRTIDLRSGYLRMTFHGG